MTCGHVSVFLRMMSFCLYENQSRLVLFVCFDFENDEGRGPTLTDVAVLKLHLVD